MLPAPGAAPPATARANANPDAHGPVHDVAHGNAHARLIPSRDRCDLKRFSVLLRERGKSVPEVHLLLWFGSMSSPAMERRARTGGTAAERERSIRILAKSLVRDLLQNGYEPGDIVNLATHILDHVAVHVGKECAKTARRD